MVGSGIEAGSQFVRKEISKGSFEDVNVREIVDQIRSYDINVIANYIVGFPDDYSSMTATNLALELNTEMVNVYPCQALPGSPLHLRAKSEKIQLPSLSKNMHFYLTRQSLFPLSISPLLKF